MEQDRKRGQLIKEASHVTGKEAHKGTKIYY
jgi:hypothetical protein